MSDSAWATYGRVRDGFALPRDGRAWRRDVVFATGLTALAAEAALRGLPPRDGAAPVVLRDAVAAAGVAPDVGGRGVLGCSFSGASAEVVDALALLRANGVPAALHGAAAACDPALRIAVGLAEPPFRHVAFCATLPVLLDGVAPDPRRAATSTLYTDFVAGAASAGAIGVFVGAGDGFRARVLASYWIEYLRRPGFVLHFPELTHDFVWALALSRARGFAFVLERPAADLSDNRFARLEAFLRALDVPLLLLDGPALGGGEHVAFLLDAADAFASIARATGAPLDAEVTFETFLQANPA